MKQFLKKIFTFFVIPGCLIVILGIIATTLISNSSYFRIDSKVTDLYIGDSHMQMAVIDSLLENSENIGLASESFYFSYFRLKKILDSENNLKSVYLGFSYHNISSYYDDFIYGKWTYSVSPKYFHVLSYGEQIRMIFHNRGRLEHYFKNIFNETYAPLFGKSKLGGYSNHYTCPKKAIYSVDSVMNLRIIEQYYKGKELAEFSEINLLYLEEIVNLCIKYNIDLVCFKTPLKPEYEKRIPAAYFEKYNELVNKYNFRLINFNGLVLDEWSYSPDGDHLSKSGALKMSKYLVELLDMRKESK